jgi:LAO/AO transport system kinase
MLTANIPALLNGDFRTLARCISAVENNSAGYEALLEQLPVRASTHIIGITGPPGAGKSTITDGLITELLEQNKKIAVIAIDPSSPFHHGALLGDRIRMSRHYNHPDVFIRSLASRGSLGGLHPEIIGISTLIGAAGFDYLIIETVGVGQSEVKIASLADTTVVVLVPESGDEIQTMKAGLMEIADIFVVNKADHEFAEEFVRHLNILVRQKKAASWNIPVIKTIATEHKGIAELIEKIAAHHQECRRNNKRVVRLLAEKAFQLILAHRMKDINMLSLEAEIKKTLEKGDFNLYRFIRNYENA